MKKLDQLFNRTTCLVMAFCLFIVIFAISGLSFANGYKDEKVIPFSLGGKNFRIKIVNYEPMSWGKQGKDVFITKCDYYNSCNFIVWTLSEALTSTMGPMDSRFEVQTIGEGVFTIIERGQKGQIIHNIKFDGMIAKIVSEVPSNSKSDSKQEDSALNKNAASAAKTDEVINNIIKEKGKVVMGIIVDIKDKNIDDASELADIMTDKIQEEFIKKFPRDKFRLVDRNRLKDIMEEQKLISSGITDANTIKLGKLEGIDIIILMVFYSSNLTMKTLSVETGEILDVQTLKLEYPKSNLKYEQKTYVLANHSFSVSPGTYRTYDWNLSQGDVLEISIKSNSDINVWFLDNNNYFRFKNGKTFSYYPTASGERIYDVKFKILIPETGVYHFVIDNKFSIVTSKGVAVSAAVTKPY